MTIDNTIPGRLETLWNVNPCLAKEAERDYKKLQEEITELEYELLNIQEL